LDKLDDDTGIFAHVDAFINMSRENETVQQVVLFPFNDADDDADGTYRYAIWERIAESIGNLQALCEITIMDKIVDDEWEAFVLDWEILAFILRRLRRGIQVYMRVDVLLPWDTAALPVFAGAIHGQAMITGFSASDDFPFHCLDMLCSALLTLPALEKISFSRLAGEGPEEVQSLESMVKLLQSPIVRDVKFYSVAFTDTLCQAVAKALKERSEITDLSFYRCSFPEGGGAMIARALKANTTLKRLGFSNGQADEVFYEVLAAALLSNSTLQDISLGRSGSIGNCSWLSPLFLALQVNIGLKKLRIFGIGLIDEKLSTAMRRGLGRNSTLESLALPGITGDNDICLWREAFSFLRTNTALKTLDMNFEQNVTESHATTIRMEVLAALRENESLETLSMIRNDTRFQDYLVCVAAIQPNTTLKRLRLHPSHGEPFRVDENETKDLITVLKKNYGLEEISGLHHGAADTRSIFELNRAGRRYLVQDGSSISKGVDVLSGVSNDINSVFLHLLENPRLCDRSAVEMSSSIGNIDNARSASPENRQSGGNREQQIPSHTGKEPRRRFE
jgi:hypothetical protein